MKDYVEVNEEKCGEVHNCMCAKEKDGKMYCRGAVVSLRNILKIQNAQNNK